MNTYRFKIYGHEYETRVVRREDDEVVISVNGQEYKAYLQPRKKGSQARPTPPVKRPPVKRDAGEVKASAPVKKAEAAGTIKAPLPGQVLKVLVAAGDQVKSGQTVCIMEAMKMENSITATADGTVSEIKVKAGDNVMEGQDLIVLG